MESTYTDIVELIDAKIEWHQAEAEKLTAMRDQLAEGEDAEPQEKPAAKRSRKPAAKKSTAAKSSNGHASGGERKQQIIEMLSGDSTVREIAEELGTHPNYVRKVKKDWETDNAPKVRSRRVDRAS